MIVPTIPFYPGDPTPFLPEPMKSWWQRASDTFDVLAYEWTKRVVVNAQAIWGFLTGAAQGYKSEGDVAVRHWSSLVNPTIIAPTTLDLSQDTVRLAVRSNIPEDDEVYLSSIPNVTPIASTIAGVNGQSVDYNAPACKEPTVCDVDFQAKILSLAVMKLMASGISLKFLEEGEDG